MNVFSSKKENVTLFSTESLHDKDDLLHVFIVANPVNSLLVNLIIDHYSISDQNVLIIPIRKSSTDMLPHEILYTDQKIYDRLLMKTAGVSGVGLRVKSYLNKLNRNFLVYSSWMYAEVEALVASRKCVGHCYIEEGQLSYYNSSVFGLLKGDWSSRRNRLNHGDLDVYFRSDYLLSFGLSDLSFPKLLKKKRVVFDKIDKARLNYIPKLLGIKNIGLLPAPRRLANEDLAAAAELLVSKLPPGSVIKVHPGYNVHSNMRKIFFESLEQLSGGEVTLCSDDISLELEMLYERKNIIGARSSVEIYSEKFGSNFEKINFKGYRVPII